MDIVSAAICGRDYNEIDWRTERTQKLKLRETMNGIAKKAGQCSRLAQIKSNFRKKKEMID